MTESFVRLARAAIGACLVFAMPALASDDIAADWRTFLAEGDFTAVYEGYALIDAVHDETGAIDAARCRSEADVIAKALVANPVGLGLWWMAQDCARASGDEALAQQRMTRFEALLRHTLANYRIGASQPIRVVAERDIEALVEASGQQRLYAMYQPYEGGRHLVYTLGLWDEKTQRENLFEIDFLDTAVTLQRGEPMAEFPYYRRSFVRMLAANAAKTAPDTPLARIDGMDLSSGTQLLEQVRARATKGDFMAAMVLATACSMKPLGCREEAIDALLPFAEKRYAVALVTLAFVYARNSDKSADLKAARALLEQADARIGGVRGSLMFMAMASLTQSPELTKLIEKPIAEAAKQGDPVAGLVYAQLHTRDGKETPRGLEREYVERAAAAGVAQAQYWLGLLRIAEKKSDEGMPLLHASAEAGFAHAQLWLGMAYLQGDHGLVRDTSKGLAWLAKAGHGGLGEASAVVGAHCLDEPGNKEDLERARGWLISGTLRGSVPAARQLAGLYARDVEGIGSSKDAVGLYEAILKDHDDAETRRYLAQMLVSGKGAEKDVARAEALLRTDAEKGDAESQSVLGAWLLDLDETDARRSEGREWLKKSAAGSTTGAVRYASALWYGRGGVVDHAKAREIWQAQIANDSTFARNDFAWAVCTPRDPALLDAKAGLAAAEARATAENAPIPIMDTYAACLAASGDHAAAATMQQRVVTAMEALPSASKEGIERMRKRLALYQRGERAVEDE